MKKQSFRQDIITNIKEKFSDYENSKKLVSAKILTQRLDKSIINEYATYAKTLPNFIQTDNHDLVKQLIRLIMNGYNYLNLCKVCR